MVLSGAIPGPFSVATAFSGGVADLDFFDFDRVGSSHSFINWSSFGSTLVTGIIPCAVNDIIKNGPNS